MFDFRYHALSLAAVLLALAVGVVIGVAIGDSNLVSSAKSGIVHDLSSEVKGAQQQAEQAHAQLAGEEAFANDLYPIAVHGLLDGQSVGLVFLGGSSNRINSLVRDAVTQAGGNLATVVAVREPLDLTGIASAAEGTRFAALGETTGEPSSGTTSTSTDTTSTPESGESGESAPSEAALNLLQDFGSILGKQLVKGGPNIQRALISRVRGPLLSAFDGQLGRLDALVLVRNAPSTLNPKQTQAVSRFESGLLEGISAVQIPVVGAELSNAEPSQIPWFQGKDLASVDDLDTTAGQAALVYALTGSHGSYGTKSTADSLLPNVAGSTTTAP
ncbi:MAG TPA: copper transporter [Solirubrobacteraceae bacterium]|nr:copper transporter [Solirubrobacteraceae bacterium]